MSDTTQNNNTTNNENNSSLTAAEIAKNAMTTGVQIIYFSPD